MIVVARTLRVREASLSWLAPRNVSPARLTRRAPRIPAEAQCWAVTTPSAEYSRRLEHRRAEEKRWSRQDARLAYARLAVFAVAVVLLVLAIRGNATPWLLAAPAVVFGALLHAHDRVLRRLTSSRRAIAF